MWLRARVGRNSLEALRRLSIAGKVYKIGKVQKLTENFEKACWRSVRTAEEYAYDRKYHFLKYVVALVNLYSKRGVSQRLSKETKISPIDHLIRKYNGENAKECIEMVDNYIAELEKLAAETCLHAKEAGVGSKSNDLVTKIASAEAFKSRLEALDAINKTEGGYSRNQLRRMAASSVKAYTLGE